MPSEVIVIDQATDVVEVDIGEPSDSVEVITPGPIGPPGPEGPPGPPGPPGGGNYVHNQIPLSDTWVVVHNLNREPSITVVDTGNSVIIPNVHYDSVNQVTLTFGAPTSGKVYVN